MNIQNIIPISRSEFVTLNVATGNNRKAFAINNTLAEKKIISIDCPQVANVTKSPDQNALISSTLYKDAFLVLVSNGREAINRLPLAALDPVLNDGKRIYLDGLEIDFSKSYVEFATAVASGDNGKDILFNFFFND